jgi:DNA-binding MarR family transcriptional regulator
VVLNRGLEVRVARMNAAEECAQAVMETVPKVMRAIREEMRRQGAPLLSIPQLRTLAYLHRRPGSCLFHVAEHLGVTRPTASAIVERLVQRGLVTRTDDPRERRRVILRPTPLGTRLYQRVRQSTQKWMVTALSQVSSERLRQITQGVSLLAEPFKGMAGRDGHPGEPGLAVTNRTRQPEQRSRRSTDMRGRHESGKPRGELPGF